MRHVARKIILPGGAGLVGQNIIPQMKELGFTNVVVIDKHKRNLEILSSLHPEVTCIEANLAQHGQWSEAFKDASAVVMLQAQIGGLEESEFINNNVHSTENVLDAMDTYNVNHLIHISSSVVNSLADDLYSSSKSKQESLVLMRRPQAVVLRPTLMFGWFDRKHLGWLARFMSRAPVFPIPGSGDYVRQPLYGRDFANIIVACLRDQALCGSYDISGLEKISYFELIRFVRDASGQTTPILRIPYRLFWILLWIWALFDKNPPFTVHQLEALVIPEEFPVIDWPSIFNVTPTPLKTALSDTFNHPTYSKVVLDF